MNLKFKNFILNNYTPEIRLRVMSEQYKRLQYQVWVYYCGCDPPCCVRCGSKNHLQIDHIAGNGGEMRKQDPSHRDIYRWLKKHDFPTGYETLCRTCNIQKRKAKRGHLIGTVRALTPEEEKRAIENGVPPRKNQKLIHSYFSCDWCTFKERKSPK